jgi:hypothetical protein
VLLLALFPYFVGRKPEGKDNLEDLDVDGRIILKCILGIYCGKLWTGFIWFRIGTSGGFHKRWGIS